MKANYTKAATALATTIEFMCKSNENTTINKDEAETINILCRSAEILTNVLGSITYTEREFESGEKE